MVKYSPIKAVSIMSTYKASEQTKKQLSDILRVKMQTKLLSKITVRELAEACGLNRQTFYYHFKDIYDLLHWTYERDAANLLQEHKSAKTWQENLYVLLSYIEENREMCLSALNSMQHHYLTKFLYTEVKPAVEALVEETAREIGNGAEFKQFLTHFYSTILSALIVDWIDRNPVELQISAEKMIDMIGITLDGTLQLAVQRYQKQHPED